MPTIRSPRHGSMQFWPRKRAKRAYARVRSWPQGKKGPLGFAGYKAGMTTVIIADNRKHKRIKGEEVAFPATIVECPPLKVVSIRLYKKDTYGVKIAKEIMAKPDKELARKLSVPKKDGVVPEINPEEYYDIRINVYTQPKLTGIGKKKPEIFELALGGSNAEKLDYAKEHLGKELNILDVFKDGDMLDAHAITKGKGFQGPVKRFGVAIRSHKAEKAIRNPGSLGGWKAQGHFMYRVAHAGQTGYHNRTEYNKLLMKISDKPEEVNPKGGFIRYGVVKNPCIIIKGSLQGPAKRLIRFNTATRPIEQGVAPEIVYVSTESKQGN